MWVRPRVFASVLLVSFAGCSSDPGPQTSAAEISTSSPTTTMTATANPVVNGRIQNESEYLTRARRACHGCEVPRGAIFETFDTRTGQAFFWWRKDYTAFTVIGPDDERARVTCGDAFACPRRQYGVNASIASGPGPDEFSVWGPVYYVRSRVDQTVHAFDFDGTVRRTINLADRLPRDASVAYVAWSPDGSRLAVTTIPKRRARGNVDVRRPRPSGRFNRIWLIEGEGEPQLVYTASRYSGPVPERYSKSDLIGHISNPSWSPDGSRLAFAEYYGPTSPSGRLTWYSFATGIFSLMLPQASQDQPGTPTMLYQYRGYPGTGNKDVVWSPDGTRLGFRKWRTAFELSAEDGTVLARRQIQGSGLVWPSKRP